MLSIPLISTRVLYLYYAAVGNINVSDFAPAEKCEFILLLVQQFLLHHYIGIVCVIQVVRQPSVYDRQERRPSNILVHLFVAFGFLDDFTRQ